MALGPVWFIRDTTGGAIETWTRRTMAKYLSKMLRRGQWVNMVLLKEISTRGHWFNVGQQ